MRTARTAATELHQLADVVLVDTAPRFADLGAIRQALRSICVFGRGQTPGDDVDPLQARSEIRQASHTCEIHYWNFAHVLTVVWGENRSAMSLKMSRLN
jgi:hypothetical protein